MHPNDYMQQALGLCLTLIYEQDGPSYQCTNTEGKASEGMVLAPSG